MSSQNPLQKLHEYGQSFWWDSLSRGAIEGGEIARMRDEDGMRGITSNPSIFHAAISSGNDYDERIASRVDRELDTESLFWDLAVDDIRDTCDLLSGVYEESDGADGFVSLEVNPHLAGDADGTVAQAKDLWKRVDRPNLMIKIPATAACMPAIKAVLVEGINVNVTLLFAQSAHIEVMSAYLEALEQRLAEGKSVAGIASVASFFISRVDSLVDSMLGDSGGLRGKAGVANARLAYQNYLKLFSGERWEKLKAAGARVQRPLWASTSTKDPSYSPILYVETLIGNNTVNTIPTVTVDAYRLDGMPAADRIEHQVEEAKKCFQSLAAAGVDMDAVTGQLLTEGVGKFNDSFDALISDLDAKVKALAAR